MRILLIGSLLVVAVQVGSACAQLPPPVPSPELPPPPRVLVPAPPPPAVVLPPRPLTLKEFAAVFQPIPGLYEVPLIHPKSGCVHVVRFSLPPGCPKVRLGHKSLEFDYGKCEVEIRFLIFNRVKVNYND